MTKRLARRMGVVPRLSLGMVSASRTIAGALACVFSVGVATATAQSLADVARQEREKRQQRCLGRVLTNEDFSRPEILSDKDRACLEAARQARPADGAAAPFSANAEIRPVPTAVPPLVPVVSPFYLESLIFPHESALPNFPLTEIAPYDREMKAARLAREAQLQRSVVVSVPPGRSRLHAAAPAPGIAPSIPQFRLQPAPLDTKLPPAPFLPSRGDAPASAPTRVETVPPVRVTLPEAQPVSFETSGLKSEISVGSVGVERGDSLWKIAERHLGSGRQWRRLATANPHITNPNLIHVGDVLQLPSSFEISNLGSEIGPVDRAKTGSPSIRVVLGDTLWALARTQFGRGAAWTCIAQANRLPNPHLILPGQTLALPVFCGATN